MYIITLCSKGKLKEHYYHKQENNLVFSTENITFVQKISSKAEYS